MSISLKRKKQEPQILVDSISFEIHRGEILGLVGESGSGKSLSSLSILQLLADPLYISDGSIQFKGKSIHTLSDKAMQKIRGKQISMIFQEPMSSLNPLMRCGQQVDEIMKIHEGITNAQAKERTLELFNQVQLPDPDRAYRAYPHQLSGGQLQRIMISMALACKPDFLIADECTTALDVTVQKEIIELLKNLNQSYGIAILFISHDLGVIADIADRVIVMRQGSIVEEGRVRRLFKAPNHPYTKQLIASKPPLDIALKRLAQPHFFESENAQAEDFYKMNTLQREDIELRQEKIMNSPAILEVQALNKAYPQKVNFWGKATAYLKAVNQVSFDVRVGETMGLVGESGCGKSSLSKAIVKLIEADSGDVLFKGSSLFGLRPKELRKKRRDIQYIFQDPYSSLNPRLSIGYAIQEPMTVHQILHSKKERKERAVELLELVGLEADHYDRYPHQFSGGQRQRICIARALSMNPAFLVCDEIVSALDVSVQAQVLNLLLDLREKLNLSMLFVSHDLAIVRFISDRLLVMKQGKIVEEGWAHDIYENPQHSYTKSLLSAIPGQQKTFTL